MTRTLEARDTVAAVAGGALRGTRHGRVVRWAGVPYAGSLAGRWMGPPPPVPAWDGVAAADRFGPSAPQPPGLLPRLFGVADTQPPAGDGCLNLTIWSADPPGAGRGVLVWVHGGGFVSGAGSQSWYDGTSFAGHGVVTVTVNYRLGALGFADLGPGADGTDGLAATNRGLLDLVAALRWVRDNIEAFGGDPGAVTVAGQSAGAMCIGALLGMPAARGLFRRAVLQSGACQTWWDRAPAAAVTSALVASTGVADGVGLAGVAPEVLLAAQSTAAAPDGGPAFRPVAGTAELPGDPLAAVAAGAAAGVDLLIGTNATEHRLFALPGSGLVERSEGRLATAGPGGGPAPLAAYRAARPGADRDELVLAALDDLEFRLPAARLAEAQAPHGEVFAYRFDWPTPALGGRLGACHTLEIPFVWNTGGTVLGAAVTGGGTPALLAERMHRAWASFVTTGRPVVVDVAAWAPYDPADRTTMIFGPATGPVSDPASAERLAWSAVAATDIAEAAAGTTARLARLADRAEILDRVADLALGPDLLDVARYRRCFADEVEVCNPHFSGPGTVRHTGDGWAAAVCGTQALFASRAHVFGPASVELRGDAADVVVLQQARFVLAGPAGAALAGMHHVSGPLRLAFARSAAGWRIHRLHFEVTWHEGDRAVFDTARRLAGRS